MNKMRLQIISPKSIMYDGECTMVEYTTTEGSVGVYPGHLAMTQVLAPGYLNIYEEGKNEPIRGGIYSGIVKIMPDVVTILAESCEFKGEIDKERAELAYKRAKERIENKDDSLDLQRAERALKRAKIRLELAK